jgi:hypothetical protein
MNPVKHKADLEAEQKYSSHCIYHLAKTHVTDDCHVKKECERMLASKRSKSGSSTPQNAVSSVSQGNLKHITEEEFADALDMKIKMSLVIILLMILMNLIYCTLLEFLNTIFI